MIAGPWRSALRMAWRTTWRNRGRSALVVALIGLPVLALAGGDVVYRSYQLTPLETYQRANGAADVELAWAGGGRVEQGPAGGYNYNTSGHALGVSRQQGPRPPGLAHVARLLGPGSHVVERRRISGTVVTPAGLAPASLVGVDYAGPVGRGLAGQVAGRAPRSPGQVDVTAQLAAQAGVRIGSKLRVLYPTRSYRVVGIVSDPSKVRVDEAFFVPGAVRATADSDYSVDFLARTRRPVTWAQVLRLDAHGYVVESRAVAEHPPPASEVPFDVGIVHAYDHSAVVSGTLVAGLALLEVILLAGPAFAVMARRQERTLALMAAAGARGRDLRNAVLAHGVVLGVVAGVAATLLGVGAAGVALPVLEHVGTTRPGPLTIRPAELTGITLVSLVTAVAAAVMPARAAARTDVVAALAGRRPRRPARLRVPATAVGVAGLGVVVALGGASRASGRSAIILAGMALVEVGLIIATPTILLVVTSAGRHLPLAPRLALRDAGRNRSSAAPAVAAVMAAVIGCVALLAGVATETARDQRTHPDTAPYGQVSVSPNPGTAPEVAAALRATLPGRSVQVLSTLGCGGPRCPSVQVLPRVARGQERTTRLSADLSDSVVVAGPAALRALTGVTSPAAEAALERGWAVVPDAWAVHHGTTTLDVVRYPAGGGSARRRAVTVPAVALTTGIAAAPAIVPPSLVPRFGTGSYVWRVVAYAPDLPSSAQTQALRAALARIAVAHPDPADAGAPGGGMQVQVASGYHNPLERRMLALILAASIVAIGAAGIATGLSNVDRAEDFVTLDAVGASSRTRRVVSAARAGVIAGIGAVLGTAAGFVPVLAYIITDNHSPGSAGAPSVEPGGGPGRLLGPTVSYRLHLVVPWGELALVVIGIPVVAAVLAAACSRSRLPVNRWALAARAG